eukprot:TRINITY_DN45641_c0_g1_i1.p1 TRINITY_DN45641_c0_g1~~TRINITY_DN45641_c0_g1_i1.p1  ORF type:complete len:141 (+),score=31.91 TRINITY_DN45641_c0_g1_i1:126-548(+)
MLSAKERRRLKAEMEEDEKARRLEDASWLETDKKINAKFLRKQQREDRADRKLQANVERKTLEKQEEMAEEYARARKKDSIHKITQAEVARRQLLAVSSKRGTSKTSVVSQPVLEPNLNRCRNVIDATGLDAALAAMESF